MRTGTSHSSQLGEVLAITFPNNAILTEASLTSAKLQLNTIAEEHTQKEDDDEKEYMIKNSEWNLLLQDLSYFRNIRPSNNKDKRRSSRAVLRGYNDIVQAICPMVRQLKESDDMGFFGKAIASPGAGFVLKLDDAVTVLPSLAQTSPRVHD